MAACPPLEDIAAFIDGTLPPEERVRMTEHLARCESCYEIFAGAVHFQEEEEASSVDDTDGGGVIQFPLAQEKIQENQIRTEPARPPRRASRWLPLAASVVLVAGLGYMVWQRSRVLPEVTVASLAEPLQGQPGLMEHRYQPRDVERSGEEKQALFSQAPPFLIGVYLLDLRLSARAGDVKSTQEALYALQTELGQMSSMQEPAQRFKEEADRMTSPAALQRFTSSLPRRERDLRSWLAEDPSFLFGLWTEAGRLSAVSRSPEFFEKRVNRRFLSAIPREISSLGDDRYAQIQKDLRQIEGIWDRGERRPEDYATLAQLFAGIIDQIEQIQKEDQEELDSLPDP